MRRIDAVGAVILDAHGRLLVVRRGHAPAAGRWSLPGGRLEPGESHAEALVREVAEETGLVVEPGDEIGRLERVAGADRYLIRDLAASVTGGSLRAGDDADEARFVTRDELLTLATTAGLVAFLDEHGVDVR